MGIEFNKLKICILLYADDIVLLAPTPKALQCMLFYLDSWCKLWQLFPNPSNVIFCTFVI